jgi:eukaryotic-like serine/threonine-protein kinase
VASASAEQAASPTPPATEAISVSQGEPPPTMSAPPPAGRHRVRNASLVGVAVLCLVVVAVGAVKLAPDQINQLTARFSSQGETAVAEAEQEQASGGFDWRSDEPEAERDAVDSASDREFARSYDSVWSRDRALVEVAPSDDADLAESASRDVDADERSDARPETTISASAARLVEAEEDSAEETRDNTRLARSEAQRQPSADPSQAVAESPAAAPARRDEPMVVAAVPESRSSSADQSTATSAPAAASAVPEAAPSRPSRVVEPAPRAATGVVVLGVGDPVFVDPMVREVERALAEQGHEVIERGYVRGLAGLLAESELNLAELSRVAVAAGAGKAVVVRAMPAGQRQLEYYGRRDTSFIVQTETVTYDLNAGRRLGASELQQVEYTALNATRQARDTIAPRLALISDQLDGGR